MSAYLCDDDHISACADIIHAIINEPNFSFNSEYESLEPEDIFKILLKENLESLNYRYPKASSTFKDEAKFHSYRYQCVVLSDRTWPMRPEIFRANVQALKALICYDYQSCEHDGWKSSQAYDMCIHAIRVLSRRIATNIPDYKKAVWGWKK